MITKQFETPSHLVKITPGPEGVALDIDGCPFVIPWDKLDNVEYVADGFGHLLVMDFRKIVEELGNVHRNKHIYEVLM